MTWIWETVPPSYGTISNVDMAAYAWDPELIVWLSNGDTLRNGRDVDFTTFLWMAQF